MKLLVMLLALTASAFGQDRQVSVTTVNDASAQKLVSFSCNINFREHRDKDRVTLRRSGSITLTNTSGKNIIAIVAQFKTNGFRESHAVNYTHDFYFKPNTFQAGDSHSLDLGDHVYGPHVIPNMPDDPAAVTGQLRFVQFDDGSTWGDATVASDILGYRQDVKDFLNHLLSIYASQGEAAMISEIEGDYSTRSIAVKSVADALKDMYSRTGITPVLADINGRLQIASGRDSSGKF